VAHGTAGSARKRSTGLIDPTHYHAPPGLLKDRVILVTGAGAGIGRALSRACAAYGATVLLLGRTISKLEKVYDEILEDGHPQPAICPMDLGLAQGPAYDELTEKIDQEYERLDGLVHNASLLGDRTPIEQYDIGKWQTVMHVNVNAPFILTQVCLPLLKRAKDASIVFTSSGVGRTGRAYWGAYAVSKFATEGLSQVLADELSDTTIRANVINPGKTRTNMRLQAYPAEDRSTLAQPEDVVAPYLYLLGPDSANVNGKSIDCQ